MQGWLKILIGIVVGLVAVVVIAIAGLLLFFDPNDYKPQINAALQRQIGRQVTLDGNIGLSVFPWLAIDLGRVTVANAPGFGDQPMATARSAQLSVRLLPLFARQIHIGTVSLHGLQLRLARNAQGKTNWADIMARLSADAHRDSAPPPEPAGGGHTFDLSSLEIGAVDIDHAAVFWSDATSGADYRATGVHIQTGRLTNGEPFRLEIGGNLVAPKDSVRAQLNMVAQIEANLATKLYRFSKLGVNVLASGKAIPGGRQEANLSASGDIDLGAGRFKLANLTLQSSGLNIHGDLDGSGLDGRLAYNGRITVDEFNPRSVMQQMHIEPPATQKKSALTSAGFDAQVNGDAKGADFKQVTATLDDSTLTGSATIRDFEQPQFGFNLDLDALNVDDYLPPGSAAQAQKPANSSAAKGGAEIDLAPLKKLELDGQLSVESLIAANIHVTQAKVAVAAHNGVLTIAPLTADLYGGKLSMRGQVNANRAPPRYALKGELARLKFAPLLKDVAGTDRLAATANMDLDLSAVGKQVAAMKRALNGDITFALKDGAFNGFNLAEVIAAARSRLTGHGKTVSGDGVSANASTPFNRFGGHVNIDNGVVSGKNLKLNAKVLNATASGRYDLVQNALDYTVKARVPEHASGALSDFAGLTVPITLTGSLWSPNYKLDVASVAREVAHKRLDKEKSKLEKKLQHKLKSANGDLGHKVQQGLSDLFGGGSQKQPNHDSSQ